MQNTTILLQNEALRAAEASSQSSVLPAAFDTVNHDILLSLLSEIGNFRKSTGFNRTSVDIQSWQKECQNLPTLPLVYLRATTWTPIIFYLHHFLR